MARSTFCILVAALTAWGAMQTDVFGRGGMGSRDERGRGGYGGGGGGYRGGGGYGGNRGGGYHGDEGGYHGGEGGYHGGEGGYHGGEGGYHGGEGGYHGGEGGYHPNYESGYHPGGYGQGGTPNHNQLNNFLGLPTDGGAGAMAHTPSASGFYNQAGTHPYSNTWAHAQGSNAQAWAQDHPQFTQAWNANHNLAWQPTGAGAAAWGAGMAGAGVYAAAEAPMLGNFLGMDSAPSDTYDYGNNVTYQGGNVYYGTQPVASSEQYSQQANDLAANAPAPTDDSEWMPLGVFSLMQGESKKPKMTVQLAVNKQGTVRGNSADPYNNVLAVQGAVDKKTQRVAWTVGEDKNTVFDSGLFNFTKDQAPVLVHTGTNETNQWLMVRLKQPNQSGGGDGRQGSTN